MGIWAADLSFIFNYVFLASTLAGISSTVGLVQSQEMWSVFLSTTDMFIKTFSFFVQISHPARKHALKISSRGKIWWQLGNHRKRLILFGMAWMAKRTSLTFSRPWRWRARELILSSPPCPLSSLKIMWKHFPSENMFMQHQHQKAIFLFSLMSLSDVQQHNERCCYSLFLSLIFMFSWKHH